MDNLIATARSNKVATCLGVQDFSRLRKDYGKRTGRRHHEYHRKYS